MSNNIKYANKFFDSPLTKGGIYGALSGVLGGGMGTILYNLLNKKKKNKWHKNVLKAMLIGGLTGTAAGIGGGAIYQHQKRKLIKNKVNSVLQKPVVKKLLGKLNNQDQTNVKNILNVVSKTGDIDNTARENMNSLINNNINMANAVLGSKNVEKLKRELNNVKSLEDLHNLAQNIAQDKDVAIKIDKQGNIIDKDKGKMLWNALVASGAKVEKMTPEQVAELDKPPKFNPASDTRQFVDSIYFEKPRTSSLAGVADKWSKKKIKETLTLLKKERHKFIDLEIAALGRQLELEPYSSKSVFEVEEGLLQGDPVASEIVENKLAQNHYATVENNLREDIDYLERLLYPSSSLYTK